MLKFLMQTLKESFLKLEQETLQIKNQSPFS